MRKIVGFTLVELLVVMAIMSILSVITFGQFQNAQKRARDVQRKSDISAISKALLFYLTDYNKVPYAYDEADKANQNIDINGLISTQGSFARDGYTYIQKMPKESVSGLNQYCYATTQDGKGFGVFSVLETKGDSECRKYVKQSLVVCGNLGTEYNYAILSPNVKLEDLVFRDIGKLRGFNYSPLFEDQGACL